MALPRGAEKVPGAVFWGLWGLRAVRSKALGTCVPGITV